VSRLRNSGSPIGWISVILTMGVGGALVWFYKSEKDRLLRERAENVHGAGMPHIGGPFALLDAEGKTRTNQEFEGKFMLVYFGFTNCPDICPAELTKMASAITLLDKDNEAPTFAPFCLFFPLVAPPLDISLFFCVARLLLPADALKGVFNPTGMLRCQVGPAALQPLFITIDPKRDTQAAIKSYTDEFNPRILGTHTFSLSLSLALSLSLSLFSPPLSLSFSLPGLVL